ALAYSRLPSFPTRRSSDLQDHVRMLGVNLVETIPDQGVVVEVEAASECDLGPRWQQDLGLCAALGCDEIPGVDHCRRERAMVDRSEEHTSELQSRENLVCR